MYSYILQWAIVLVLSMPLGSTLNADLSVAGNRFAGERGFQDKTLFITGATGFVGKVYIEKVLRTCPLVKKIYVLVRTKRNKDLHLRMKNIFEGPLFDILRKETGDEIFQKVVPISGDIMEIGLGISQEDRELLRSEVQIIFHSAATVRFDEPMKRAVLINTRGTKFMLDLAKECKNLLVFTYVSTAYCHPNEKKLYEKAYPPPADPDTVINIVEWLGDLGALNDKILGTYPNTYGFTKALAEDLVAREFDNLPVIILRPSIVVPIWKDPIPGWNDNMNGPTGMFIAGGKGVLKSMYGDPKGSADFIPVDVFINLSLFATFNYLNYRLWRVQQKIRKSYEVLEYYYNNQWEFINDESFKARSVLTEDEKNIYKLDDHGIDIEDYFYKCTHSARLYLLNEPDSTIPSAKRHIKIMWAVDQIAHLIFYIGFTYLIYTHIISPIFGI